MTPADQGHAEAAASDDQASSDAHDRSVVILLDEREVTSPSRRRNGRQIRELGPADRVEGFETQEIDKKGKKVRTIRDDQEIQLHEHDRFRTVPSEGGPGGRA